MLGFAQKWWGQVIVVLAFIAALDRFTGFRADVGSLATGTGQIINDLKV